MATDCHMLSSKPALRRRHAFQNPIPTLTVPATHRRTPSTPSPSSPGKILTQTIIQKCLPESRVDRPKQPVCLSYHVIKMRNWGSSVQGLDLGNSKPRNETSVLARQILIWRVGNVKESWLSTKNRRALKISSCRASKNPKVFAVLREYEWN